MRVVFYQREFRETSFCARPDALQKAGIGSEACKLTELSTEGMEHVDAFEHVESFGHRIRSK